MGVTVDMLASYREGLIFGEAVDWVVTWSIYKLMNCDKTVIVGLY